MPEHLVQAEELQAYLDRELAPTRQAEVERHLLECKDCSPMIADLKRVSAALQHWQVEPAPEALKRPVFEVRQTEARGGWGRLVIGLAGSAALILIIAAISIPNLLRSRLAVPPPSPAVRHDTYAMRTEAARTTDSSTYMYEQARRAIREQRTLTGGIPSGQKPQVPPQFGRLVTYQVTMTIEVKEFDPAKKKVLQLVEQAGGYIAQSSAREIPNQPRGASLTLRVPVAQLSVVLEQIRSLGRVTQEQLATEEVTEQVVDLEARLRNSHATEQRLLAVLSTRTGSVADILEVEREIARTRQEIERMEAQRQNLLRRVELATVTVTLAEEFKAQLERAPFATAARVRNAFIDGYRNFVDSALGLTVFLVSYGPALLFWLVLGWLMWRGGRHLFRRAVKPGA